MNEEIMEMLDEAIKAEINGLSSLQSGSKEKNEAIEGVAKLYRLRIDDSKAAMEDNNRIVDDEFRRDQMERDEQSRKEQMAEQIKDRYFKLGIAAAELILPLMFYAVWMHRGFKFEEEGTYTSTTFRGLFNRFRPTKK